VKWINLREAIWINVFQRCVPHWEAPYATLDIEMQTAMHNAVIGVAVIGGYVPRQLAVEAMCLKYPWIRQ
jgi:hypothetical protein